MDSKNDTCHQLRAHDDKEEEEAAPRPLNKRTKTYKRQRLHKRNIFLPLYFIIAIFLLSSSLSSSLSSQQQHTATTTHAFSLSDEETNDNNDVNNNEPPKTLDLHEISNMRVRDIKRRLSRQHGYSNAELSKMIDKKELIHALSYEEHKVSQKLESQRKRAQMKQGVIVALICVCVVLFWPLFVQLWEMVSVNFVVYTDKKKYELSRCYELSSNLGYIGILLLFFLDLLQLWLTASVILSWFISSSNRHLYRYLFPIPRLSIRPAALLAGAMGGNAGPLGQYGINIGSMLITWIIRYVKSQVEAWVGSVFSKALKRQRKEKKKQQKEWESKEEREERKRQKALRREERKKRKEEEERKAEEERKQQRERDVEEIRKRSEQSVVTTSTSNKKDGDGETTNENDNNDNGGNSCCQENNNYPPPNHEKENINQNEYYSQGEVPSWLNDDNKNSTTEKEENDVVGSGFDELD